MRFCPTRASILKRACVEIIVFFLLFKISKKNIAKIVVVNPKSIPGFKNEIINIKNKQFIRVQAAGTNQTLLITING